jgi:DNA-binding NarL/FixJ family response regulator
VAGVVAPRAGDSTISPSIAGRFVSRRRENDRPRVTEPKVYASPTSREVEVLTLVARGKENSAIAEELYISPRTFKNHVASILRKRAIENRIQAAVLAVKSGLV